MATWANGNRSACRDQDFFDQPASPLVVQHHPSMRGNASCAERAENWRAMRETAAILGMPATRTNTH
jgi:hypothetical protein